MAHSSREISASVQNPRSELASCIINHSVTKVLTTDILEHYSPPLECTFCYPDCSETSVADVAHKELHQRTR